MTISKLKSLHLLIDNLQLKFQFDSNWITGLKSSEKFLNESIGPPEVAKTGFRLLKLLNLNLKFNFKLQILFLEFPEIFKTRVQISQV